MLDGCEVVHDQTKDEYDRHARAEQGDRENDDASHPDRVGLVAASRPANLPLGNYVFHCHQPPALAAVVQCRRGHSHLCPSPPACSITSFRFGSLSGTRGLLFKCLMKKAVERPPIPSIAIN